MGEKIEISGNDFIHEINQCKGNKLEFAKEKLQLGYSLENGYYGDSALLCAIEQCPDIEIIKLFLENGADINTSDQDPDWGDGGSALHLAAKVGRIDIIDLLIQYGADINRLDDSYGTAKVTPIDWAVFYNQKEAYLHLEKLGADTSNALFIACSVANLPFIEFLLEKGKDINQISNHKCKALKGKKPLDVAISPFWWNNIDSDKNRPAVIQYLRDHGAQAVSEDNSEKN